jgi:hypothetical protein
MVLLLDIRVCAVAFQYIYDLVVLLDIYVIW